MNIHELQGLTNKLGDLSKRITKIEELSKISYYSLVITALNSLTLLIIIMFLVLVSPWQINYNRK